MTRVNLKSFQRFKFEHVGMLVRQLGHCIDFTLVHSNTKSSGPINAEVLETLAAQTILMDIVQLFRC